MVDFTIGINISDGEIGLAISLEDRDEVLTIEEAARCLRIGKMMQIRQYPKIVRVPTRR